MSKGYSLHIGLNHVDPAGYLGWDGELTAAVNDARSMEAICATQGFDTTVVTDGDATADAVLGHLGRIAATMHAGDIAVCSYSGHGGQLPDVSGDDEDHYDETWCLWDRELVDDELAAAWTDFPAGARVLLLSDSCHSGTVLRKKLYDQLTRSTELQKALGRHATRSKGKPLVWREIPPPIQDRVYAAHRERYDRLRDDARAHVRASAAVSSNGGRSTRSGRERPLTQRDMATTTAATVLLISACQDSQLALDGDDNGLFTGTLIEVWNHGAFAGSHREFTDEITRRSPPTQCPNMVVVGAPNPGFELRRPFEVAAPPVRVPSVWGPPSWGASEGPPTFDVDLAGAAAAVLEITSRPEYLDGGRIDREGAPEFWASWLEPDGRFSGERYRLPAAVWTRMCRHERLWFRIGTTASPTGWDGWQVSTPDGHGGSAPSLVVRADAAPAAPGVLSIRGPREVSRNTGPPEFVVDVAGGYGMLEITSRPEYLDADRVDREGDGAHFWATWLNGSVSTYPLWA